MNQNQNVNWVQNQPYTVMLAAYRLAAERLQNRLEQLKQELRHLQQCKQYTRESADREKDLEHRMDLLRSEYYELTESMREIRIYAEKEHA